jgi:hypothetical protein
MDHPSAGGRTAIAEAARASLFSIDPRQVVSPSQTDGGASSQAVDKDSAIAQDTLDRRLEAEPSGQNEMFSQLARLLTPHITQPISMDTASTKSNDTMRNIFVQIIGNVSATGGSRLFAGINTAVATPDSGQAPRNGISAFAPSYAGMILTDD